MKITKNPFICFHNHPTKKNGILLAVKKKHKFILYSCCNTFMTFCIKELLGLCRVIKRNIINKMKKVLYLKKHFHFVSRIFDWILNLIFQSRPFLPQKRCKIMITIIIKLVNVLTPYVSIKLNIFKNS